MSKIVFIAGCSHSGSTLLEMLLSAHHAICGLGEIQKLLDLATRPRYVNHPEDGRCSCGDALTACRLWAPFMDWMDEHAAGDFASGYRELLRRVRQTRGSSTIIVDSSKYPYALARLADFVDAGELGNTEIVVLHIVKDIRAWATSMKYRYTGGRLAPLKWFGRWHKDNRKIERLLKERRLRHIRIGYEELCFNGELVLKGICSELDVEFSPRMLHPAKASAHIGVGNPMRWHPNKSQRLIYDNRWFFEWDVNMLYALQPRIRRYNGQAVYGNSRPAADTLLFEPAA